MLKSKAVSSPQRRPKAPTKTQSAVSVADETIQELAEILRIIADKSRLKILLALARDGELHVSALCAMLGEKSKPASQPAVSHHLTLLRLKGLVSFRREGKNNFYRVEPDRLSDLLEAFFQDTGNGHRLFQFPGFSLTYRNK